MPISRTVPVADLVNGSHEVRRASADIPPKTSAAIIKPSGPEKRFDGPGFLVRSGAASIIAKEMVIQIAPT